MMTVPYADIPHAFAVVVTTDRLRGALVAPGDLLIVDTDHRQPAEGDLVVVRHNLRGTVAYTCRGARSWHTFCEK